MTDIYNRRYTIEIENRKGNFLLESDLTHTEMVAMKDCIASSSNPLSEVHEWIAENGLAYLVCDNPFDIGGNTDWIIIRPN